MKSIRRNVVLVALTALCIGMYSIAGDSKEVKVVAKPYSYGEYLVITCHRVEGAGKFPISYSEHEVTAINGKKLGESFKTHVEYLDSFHTTGNHEVVISGYYTTRQIGNPEWPKASPEVKYMDYSQRMFSFIDFFIATGVRSPEREKKRFEEDVVSVRRKLKFGQ